MSKAPATLWRSLEDFPPYYVRILAKRPGSGLQNLGLTDSDIAIKSGIPLSRIREIARMANWHDCTVGELLNFTIACGFDPANPRDRQRVKQYEYVCRKRGKKPFQWLKMSPKYESEYLPLLQLLKAKLLNGTSSPTPVPAS